MQGCTQQALSDLIAWVEEGVDPPASTRFRVDDDAGVHLDDGAARRGGIQPTVVATADAATRADVHVGQTVRFEAVAEVPPGAGAIVSAEWDLDGSGDFGRRDEEIDGTATTAHLSTTHAFDAPGTWFPAVRVTARRDGDSGATTRRVPNLGRVRVVVRPRA
jgi:hypothetical protein